MHVILDTQISTVLWTQRHNRSVRQSDHPYEPGERPVPSTAGFDGNGLADGVLEMALADATDSKKLGRRALERPGFHPGLVTLRIHGQPDVGIPPVGLGERAGSRESLVEVEGGRHVVMRPRRGH